MRVLSPERPRARVARLLCLGHPSLHRPRPCPGLPPPSPPLSSLLVPQLRRAGPTCMRQPSLGSTSAMRPMPWPARSPKRISFSASLPRPTSEPHPLDRPDPACHTAIIWHDPANPLVAQLHYQAGGVQNIRLPVPVVLEPESPSYAQWRDLVLLTLRRYASTTTSSSTPWAWSSPPRGSASTASSSPGSWGRSPRTSTTSSATLQTLAGPGWRSRVSFWATLRPGLCVSTRASERSFRATSPSASSAAR